MSSQYLENDGTETPPFDPIIYGPKPTPNANPLGNLPLVTGIGVFVVIAVCIVASVGETQKDASERNSWFKWLVDYSIEKQEREGRAPARASYGPFGYHK